MAKKVNPLNTPKDCKAASAELLRDFDKLERELSKRDRKEAIQNARKRQVIFGCRL